MNLYREIFDSDLGQMVVVASDNGVCFLAFGDMSGVDKEQLILQEMFDAKIIDTPNAFTAQTRQEIDEYFNKQRTVFEVPLDIQGTSFQCQVWEQLKKIPYGEITYYQALAAAVNRPSAMRAVALANKHNRISIIIPCHRVIGKKGDLVGYSGGLWRKEKLLLLEKTTVDANAQC
ncbi:methylated-DNA--[protein]-cysteine S-methyltransferase [Pelistega europaea]|uniref:methylated-DNA--[protein]-cysteine S-methyltransferase n=1 Tax=Pelistega europaea TaxID=106147 RepID=A0A7Y4L9U2_9BURK|nr:methylated-DNA--[protein]-cysteine S-methyltransferase [Pelistega europaea]NOL49569.1 methylated-DNA--[protein]-cysteine S-methyltransferase [Pelistega europaea]